MTSVANTIAKDILHSPAGRKVAQVGKKTENRFIQGARALPGGQGVQPSPDTAATSAQNSTSSSGRKSEQSANQNAAKSHNQSSRQYITQSHFSIAWSVIYQTQVANYPSLALVTKLLTFPTFKFTFQENSSNGRIVVSKTTD